MNQKKLLIDDKTQNRQIGLDIIRTSAIFFVLSVHYFLYSNFYTTLEVKGIYSFILIFFRWLFYCCVPLFLLLTGYLNINKKYSCNYFKKLFFIFFDFTITLIIIYLVSNFALEKNYIFIDFINDLLSFKSHWYLGMYIGLYLLIPFLNKLSNSLSKEEHKHLIITLLFISGLSSVLSGFKISNFEINIFSKYWNFAYPILYYYIGLYIKKFKVTTNKWKLFSILILSLIIETLICYLYYYNSNFDWKLFDGYGSLITVIASVSIFLLLYCINIKSTFISKVFTLFSKVSLIMYFLTKLYDPLFYAQLNTRYTFYQTTNRMLKYMPFITGINIFTSFISSCILYYIYNLIHKFLEKIIMEGNCEKNLHI